MELINNLSTCKAAINLGVHTSYGEKCLNEACKSNFEIARSSSGQLHFGGRSSVLGEDAFDEEICWCGNRVVWSAARIVRRRFTLDSTVLQVAWAKFADNGASSTLCMLQQSQLTTYTLNGHLQTVPVPASVTSLHPVPQGLLLNGAESARCSILTHPLEEVQALSAEFTTDVSASWQGERVIWSSPELPYLATYSKKLGRLALWHIKYGDPAPTQHPAGLQPRTPAQLLRPPNGGIPQSASKRQSLRLADGRLSPAAFSPVSRAAEAAAANARAAGLEPTKLRDKPKLVASFLWQHQVAADACPDQGHLATDHDGAPLLLLHSRSATRAIALRLPVANAPHPARVEVAFTLDAVAAAAVESTRKRGVRGGPRPPGGGTSPGPPARDILLLHPTGRLSLYIGSRHVCNLAVNMRDPGRFARYAPVTGGDRPVERVAETPQKTRPSGGDSPGGSFDCSMDEAGSAEGGGGISPGSEGVVSGPNVAGLGEALEAPPEIVDLTGAVGDRVTVRFADGRAMRIALPFTPVRPLPGLALDALKEALDPPVWHALFCRFITSPGSSAGGVEREWGAFTALLLRWARDPVSLSAPSLRQRVAGGGLRGDSGGGRGGFGSTSQSTDATDATTPAATPGGSVDSGPSAAWEALLQSAQHRKLLQERRYPWLRGSEGAPKASVTPDSSAASTSGGSPDVSERSDVAKALQALHAIYEDFKLDLLRWHLLPKLARLLCQLASLLGARAHLDHYQRDMGPCIASDIPLPSTPGGKPGATAAQQELRPVPDIHKALHAMLSGDREAASLWLPQLTKQECSCVSRSVDVTAFYRDISFVSGQCCEELLREPGRDSSSQKLRRTVVTACEGIALLLWQRGWSLRDLDCLPVGVALPIREALHRCRADPPACWPPAAYTLVGRADLAAMAAAASQRDPSSRGGEGGPNDVGGTAPVQAPGAVGATGLNLRAEHNGPRAGRIPALSPMWQPQLRTPAPAARSRLSIGGGPGPAEAASAGAAAAAEAAALAAASQAAAAAASTSTAPKETPQRPASASTPSPSPQHEDFYRRAPVTMYTQRLLIPGLAEEAALDERQKNGASLQDVGPSDGIEGLFDGCELRFGRDKRLAEVRRLLASNEPSPLRVAAAPEAGDPEQMQAQQLRLMALGTRTMALPFGRAALTLGTMRPLPTEPLPIPPLCLSGRLPEQHNATVNLDLTASQPPPGGGAAADITAWPEFHNGVAAGLRMAPGCAQMTRTWIVYNKPKVASYTHAGMIMGLGLTNHLACLSATDLFSYLSQYHDATIMAVLLGIGAAKAGTMDEMAAKMLSLHVPSRHPQTYPEVELSPLVQSAALMGVGLLFRGTCHRETIETMLNEIGRRPGSLEGGDLAGGLKEGAPYSEDREGYALAAGFALGLVSLGKGRTAIGLSDLHVEDRLRYYMTGGNKMGARAGDDTRTGLGPGIAGFDPTSGADPIFSAAGRSEEQQQAQQTSSQVVLEGNLVNMDVTSPAATLALALMYLKTNDAAIAASFFVPDTHFALDYVKPDFVLLRMLARGLVLWDSVQPTKEWVQSQLPDLIKGPVSEYMGTPEQVAALNARAGHKVDLEALAQAHVCAIAGACLALGIKFAGSANSGARAVLTEYLHYMLAAKNDAPDGFGGAVAAWGRLDKMAIENCICTIALALAAVMAGSGHLQTLCLFRGLLKRLHPVTSVPPSGPARNYGSHMALSMAIGFLFLGGGSRTFATNNAAVAALVIALYPRLPASTMDHRCHLQAFRHLYVLASEPRCVDAIDVHTRESVYVPLSICSRPLSSPLARPANPSPGTGVRIRHEDLLDMDSAEMRRGLWNVEEVLPRTSGRSSDAEGAGRGMSVRKTAPCLLPEEDQVEEVQVCGPRYWQQRLAAASGGSGGGPSGGPLASLFRTRTLFVQRKSGALSYMHDPSGVRSLLSHSLDEGSGPGGNGFDLVHLCSTFAANPFVMAFARRLASGSSQSSIPGGTASEAFHSFCRSCLRECIAEDKLEALGSYLFLYSLVDVLAGSSHSGPSASNAGSAWGLRALTGGISPTVPVWSLKLALAYHSSGLGLACAHISRQQPGRDGPSGEGEWRPLLRPAFLELLWQRVAELWRVAGHLPSGASPTAFPSQLLQGYIQTGAFPVPDGSGSRPVCALDLFGAFLALQQFPDPQTVASALKEAAAAAAHASAAGAPVKRRRSTSSPAMPLMASQHAAVAPVLAASLPDTPSETVALIAACVP